MSGSSLLPRDVDLPGPLLQLLELRALRLPGPEAETQVASLPFLGELVALLAVSVAVAWVCQRFGLVPIVGFLLAGVLIGPHALGLVRDEELIDGAAEIGVILLLFTIGLEFSLERLGRIKRLIFGGGAVQVGLTVAVVAGGLSLFGVPWPVGIFTGCLVALSSTVIVLKLFSDAGETDTRAGQAGLGILIFQDLAIIVMVLLVPILAGRGGSGADIALALGKAAGIIVLVLVFARRIMPRLLEAVARTCSPELFLLATVAICFGTAWVTSLAGVSVALGAFLAGLIISESRFSEHAFSEILPLQILFSAAFFVSVGMMLDPGFVLMNPLLVLGAVAGVLLLKIAVTSLSLRLVGERLPVAAAAGLTLAQVGEFSFVLERAGRDVGLSPAGLGDAGGQIFVAGTVLLMVATPFLAQVGRRAQKRLLSRPTRAGAEEAEAGEPGAVVVPEGHGPLQDHIIVGGYGEAARQLIPLFEAEGVPSLILTLSPEGAREAEQDGRRVLRGDYARQNILERAGIDRARMLIVADDEPGMTHRVVVVARTIRPSLPIVVRTRSEGQTRHLRAAGAGVVSDELASALHLAEIALGHAVERPTAFSPELASDSGRRSVVALNERQLASSACAHLASAHPVEPTADGCEECLKTGDRWVHLRICMACGHVGCCDSSPNRHATAHFHATEHPIVRTFETDEDWAWCYEEGVRL